MRFPMVDIGAHFNEIRASDHFIDRAEAEFSHELTHLLRDQAHEVHDV